MKNIKVFKQQQIGLVVIILAYLLLIFSSSKTENIEGLSWIGLGIIGLFVLLGILRIKFYGDIKFENGRVVFWNFIFQKQIVLISDIESIVVKGLWIKGLKLKIKRASNESYSRYLIVGAMDKKDVVEILSMLVSTNPSIKLDLNSKNLLEK